MAAAGSDEFDVIVVGGGNAAFCAALSAQEQGARVVVLERAPEEEAGGNTRFTARRADFAPNQGTIGNVSSFGLDQAGNLYIVDFDGDIFRIEPRP